MIYDFCMYLCLVISRSGLSEWIYANSCTPKWFVNMTLEDLYLLKHHEYGRAFLWALFSLVFESILSHDGMRFSWFLDLILCTYVLFYDKFISVLFYMQWMKRIWKGMEGGVKEVNKINDIWYLKKREWMPVCRLS